MSYSELIWHSDIRRSRSPTLRYYAKRIVGIGVMKFVQDTGIVSATSASVGLEWNQEAGGF